MLNSDSYPANKQYYNSYTVATQALYAQLRSAGYTVTITDAAHLEENPCGIRALIVPDTTLLSPEETAQVEAFIAKGGKVYMNVPGGDPARAYCGLQEYTTRKKSYKERVFAPYFTANDLPRLTGIIPIARSMEPNVGVQVLQGEDYTLLVLTDISPVEGKADATIRVSIPFETAEFVSIDGSRPVEVAGDLLIVRNMTDGGILILK
jgi:hypothetical protein